MQKLISCFILISFLLLGSCTNTQLPCNTTNIATHFKNQHNKNINKIDEAAKIAILSKTENKKPIQTLEKEYYYKSDLSELFVIEKLVFEFKKLDSVAHAYYLFTVQLILLANGEYKVQECTFQMYGIKMIKQSKKNQRETNEKFKFDSSSEKSASMFGPFNTTK